MITTARLFALLPACLLASPVLAAPVAPGDTLLTLSAEGKVSRAPDIASFSTGITASGRTASAAMAASANAMTAMLAALERAGVARRDVQTSNLSLGPVYADRKPGDDSPPRISGYQASQQVTVRSRDVAATGRLLDALVAAGANQISGPDFSLADPEAAQAEARAQAIAKARQHAETYASAAGLKVARILSISEAGEIQPPRPLFAMARMAEAATPIAAGEVDAGVRVSVEFELAPASPPR